MGLEEESKKICPNNYTKAFFFQHRMQEGLKVVIRINLLTIEKIYRARFELLHVQTLMLLVVILTVSFNCNISLNQILLFLK